MANPPPTPNPWTWQTADLKGSVIRITVAWNNASRDITGITTFRDPDCDFTQILIGLGVGNSPNTTDKAFTIPAGTTTVPQNRLNQLAQRGLATIDDVLALQITAA